MGADYTLNFKSMASRERENADVVEAFAPDKRAHELEMRRRKILGNVVGGTALMGSVGLIIGAVVANAERLTMGPDPDAISLQMAHIAALRVETECGVRMTLPPHSFKEDEYLEGQSNFTTAPLSYGQDVCIEGVFETLASTVDGCSVRYVQSGWRAAGEQGARYAVRTDCLPNYRD